jgi:voltage-gated potassium channel
MAEVILRPTVVDFINSATMHRDLGLAMEEVCVKDRSKFIGKNLIESNLRRDFGIIIVAIKKNSGDMIFNPVPQEKLDANDVLVVLGKKEDVARMNTVI